MNDQETADLLAQYDLGINGKFHDRDGNSWDCIVETEWLEGIDHVKIRSDGHSTKTSKETPLANLLVKFPRVYRDDGKYTINASTSWEWRWVPRVALRGHHRRDEVEEAPHYSRRADAAKPPADPAPANIPAPVDPGLANLSRSDLQKMALAQGIDLGARASKEDLLTALSS